ncbi:hypothetical protein [Acutalibacter muris]|uniref:hypothetical protein n=1 Tax=Acutalibacter muris TaxID=1796620 RepID=UPI001C3EE385|nr:hypothetical protein [Acutalibacter muris]
MKPITIERRKAGQARRKRQQAFPWYERAEVWTVAKYAALTLAGIVLFRAGQTRALIERGYAAVGGEAFALFLPAFYYLISRAVRDMIEDAKNDTLQK